MYYQCFQELIQNSSICVFEDFFQEFNYFKNIFYIELVHSKLTFPKNNNSFINMGHDAFMNPYHKLWTMTLMLI